VEPASGEDIATGLLKIAENPGAAREKVRETNALTAKQGRAMIDAMTI
jgi:hypothetical protein